MHTLLFVIGGLVLLAVCLGSAKAMAAGSEDALRTATMVFALLWFVIAAVNMAVGVLRAGYPFNEELPIFLLIFFLPVAVAVFLQWKVL
jgi:hypothetical protein